MRKITSVALALSFSLAGCGGGSSSGSDAEKPAAASSAKPADTESAAAPETAEAETKPAKPSTGSGSGKWDIDTHECSAMMESGERAIKIQQTDSDLKIYLAPAWAAKVDGSGKLTVGGEATDYETTQEQGHDWIVVTSSNDDFGGIRDLIENGQTLKVSYSGNGAKQDESFSLKGTGGVMEKLRKCAGL
ncbi:hypothetical protein [Sphingomonas sp.]|uniref:hypothetical protein n=1 Tax=Sphingomonas sp. TaxID=28214 RepID=UPI001ED3DA86|nr:hypothetical protein [Sphingomonas sp.]MBX3594880.1 hypothetical protein [Sphingomonas sp.]